MSHQHVLACCSDVFLPSGGVLFVYHPAAKQAPARCETAVCQSYAASPARVLTTVPVQGARD